MAPGHLSIESQLASSSNEIEIPVQTFQPSSEHYAQQGGRHSNIAGDTRVINAGISAEDATEQPVFGSGIVYDSRMMFHATLSSEMHPERPERIARIFDVLQRNGCVARMKRIPSRAALLEEAKLVHSEEMWHAYEHNVREYLLTRHAPRSAPCI